MAIVSMAPAVNLALASASEYNKLISNIIDIDTRLGNVLASPSADSRLGTLETRTLDTVTTGGIGNQRLADRLGIGVGTGSNVLTGSASSQLTDIRSRLTAVEATAGTGAPVVQSAPGNSGTHNTTTYVYARTGGAGNEAQTVFVAPPSGKVKITWASGITIASAGGFALVSFRVRTGASVGAGTDIIVASDAVTCQNTGLTSENSYSNFYLLESLTAGASYNIQLAYRTSGALGTFNRPKVLIEPMLA